MKITNKLLIMFGAVIFLISTNNTALAVDDANNDVLHWTGYSWADWEWNIADRDDVDINSLDYTLTDTTLTLIMTVDGSVTSANSFYHMWYNSTDAWYHASVIDGEGSATAYPFDIADYALEELSELDLQGEVSIEGNTITATFTLLGEDNSLVDMYGWAQEWEGTGDMYTDFWIDYAPNDYSPYGDYFDYYGEGDDDDNDETGDDDDETGGDDDDDENTQTGGEDTGTPGFEIFTLIAAIAIAFIALKRKK